MKPLDGKTALVTGCRGRLGPVWMRALEDAGARVIGVDRDDYDLSTAEGCASLARAYTGESAAIDILVNNAGVDSRPDMQNLAQPMVDVNVLGTSRLCHAFGLDMVQRGSGVIVNIASLYGLVAPDMRYYNHRPDKWAKDGIYGATKAAIISLTQYWAARLGPFGVRVNALAPGGIIDPADPLTAGDAEFRAKYTARIPLRRMCEPRDLGGPLVFLASDASSFITGHTIPIDGGYLTW